jgi:hypothetical protein
MKKGRTGEDEVERLPVLRPVIPTGRGTHMVHLFRVACPQLRWDATDFFR